MLTVAAMQFTLTKVGKLLGKNNCVATPIRWLCSTGYEMTLSKIQQTALIKINTKGTTVCLTRVFKQL